MANTKALQVFVSLSGRFRSDTASEARDVGTGDHRLRDSSAVAQLVPHSGQVLPKLTSVSFVGDHNSGLPIRYEMTSYDRSNCKSFMTAARFGA